jgi:hypothetical protein
MTDIARLIADLEAVCVGHPNARIPWPHRLLHRAIDQLRADHPEGGAATASHACYAVTAFLLKHTADGFNYQLMLDVIEASDAESARATYGLRAKDAWPEHALRDVLALGIAAPGAPGPEGGALSVVDEIAQERRRQIEAEGFNAEHDAQHGPGELALAGACYALWDFPVLEVNRIAKELWPWADRWWKPKSVRHDLIRAAALIVAEIERLDRGAAPTEPRPEAVDEALTSLARETDALGLYDDSTKPTLAAQNRSLLAILRLHALLRLPEPRHAGGGGESRRRAGTNS